MTGHPWLSELASMFTEKDLMMELKCTNKSYKGAIAVEWSHFQISMHCGGDLCLHGFGILFC